MKDWRTGCIFSACAAGIYLSKEFDRTNVQANASLTWEGAPPFAPRCAIQRGTCEKEGGAHKDLFQRGKKLVQVWSIWIFSDECGQWTTSSFHWLLALKHIKYLLSQPLGSENASLGESHWLLSRVASVSLCRSYRCYSCSSKGIFIAFSGDSAVIRKLYRELLQSFQLCCIWSLGQDRAVCVWRMQ